MVTEHSIISKNYSHITNGNLSEFSLADKLYQFGLIGVSKERNTNKIILNNFLG